MSDSSQGSGWWLASDGKWYPPHDAVEVPPSAPTDPSAYPPPPADPVSTYPPPPAVHLPAPPSQGFLLTIGDIGVSADRVVTPNGTAPLAGSQWIVTDRSVTETKIPTWAIVLAIVFALACLLGLLFLLVKETVTRGYVEVSVRSGDLAHMTQLPVRNVDDVARYRQMVGQAQTLAAQSASS